jgi:hypothetical protein
MEFQGGKEAQNERQQDQPQPGPIYDRAMRTFAEDDPDAFCDWLGVPYESPVEVLSSGFPAETLYADLVARVGPNEILHAEYIRTPTPDMAARMVSYLGQLMRQHPGCSIFQYAIVLGQGRLNPCTNPKTGFNLGLRTIYLRESDPAELMAYPNLAGLTVLAQGDTHARGRALADAIQRVRDLPEERQERLTNAMLVVATIALDRSTIDLIVKESGMTIETVAEFYSGTEVGQELRNQGREEGAARTLAALLRARFGDHPQVRDIAEHLAHALDDDASIRIVTEAHTLDDLSSWFVPTQPDAP